MSFWRIVAIYSFILYVIFGALLLFIPLFCIYNFWCTDRQDLAPTVCVNGRQPYSLTGTFTYTHLARKCTRGSLKTISRILPTNPLNPTLKNLNFERLRNSTRAEGCKFLNSSESSKDLKNLLQEGD